MVHGWIMAWEQFRSWRYSPPYGRWISEGSPWITKPLILYGGWAGQSHGFFILPLDLQNSTYNSRHIYLQHSTYNSWPFTLLPLTILPLRSSWSRNITAQFSTPHALFYMLYFILMVDIVRGDEFEVERARVWVWELMLEIAGLWGLEVDMAKP